MLLKDLKKQFEMSLRQSSYKSGESGHPPNHPMLIFFLGDEALKAYQSLELRISQIWPQFKKDIQYFKVEKTDKNFMIKALTEGNEIELSGSDFDTLASKGFNQHSKFPDKYKLDLAFVLATDDCESSEDFNKWYNIIRIIKKQAAFQNNLYIYTPIFLLTNDKKEKHSLISGIKEILRRKFMDTPEAMSVAGEVIILLSNVLDDGTILDDRISQYQAIARILTLLNSSINEFAKLYQRVLTIGYERREKPFEDIAQTVMLAFCEIIKHDVWGNSNKTFSYLKKQYQQVLEEFLKGLVKPLPPIDVLLSLPRQDISELQDVYGELAVIFNQKTFETFKSFIDLLNREEGNQNVKEKFKQTLSTRFLPSDLILISDDLDNMSYTLLSDKPELRTQTVSKYYESMSLYALLEEYKPILKSVLKEEIETLKKNWNSIDSFLNNKEGLYSIADYSLEKSYQKEAEDFWKINCKI